MLGIEKTLETMQDIGNLAVNVITIVRAGGFKLVLLPKIFDSLQQINELVQDAPKSIAELKDLDALESAKVGAAAFEMFKKIISAATVA